MLARTPKLPKAELEEGRAFPYWELFAPTWDELGTLDGYLHNVLDRCASWFSASGASIFLHDELDHTFSLAAKAGSESRVPDDASIELGKGRAGRAIAARSPALFHSKVDSEEFESRGIRSSLIVPLVTTDGEAVGVLNLSRGVEAPKFGRSDLGQARSIASHIALAVSNGRLLSKLRKSVAYNAELHRRLDTIIESLGVGILVVRRNGTISHLNIEAQSWSPHARVNDTLQRFCEGLPAALRGAVESVGEGALSAERVNQFVREPGSHRAWSIVGAPLPDGGATLVVQDATEQEQLNVEMNRVKRLAEIGQMTAAIAHEIRNPLTAMRGAAQLIQSDPEHAVEMAQIIQLEVEKLNTLCSEFLEFARPLELHQSQVDLGEISARIASQHRMEFEQKNVELDVETEFPALILGDPIRIEQVIRNLLLNALHATDPGGWVRLRAGGSSVAVEDSGKGLAPEVAERLFTPFFTTKPQGTGLGLSTVRKIVEAHNGSIEWQSRPNEGTKFTVNWMKTAA